MSIFVTFFHLQVRNDWEPPGSAQDWARFKSSTTAQVFPRLVRRVTRNLHHPQSRCFRSATQFSPVFLTVTPSIPPQPFRTSPGRLPLCDLCPSREHRPKRQHGMWYWPASPQNHLSAGHFGPPAHHQQPRKAHPISAWALLARSLGSLSFSYVFIPQLPPTPPPQSKFSLDFCVSFGLTYGTSGRMIDSITNLNVIEWQTKLAFCALSPDNTCLLY